MRARLGSADLSFEVRGDGPTVLFLHAFPLGEVQSFCRNECWELRWVRVDAVPFKFL